MLFRWLFVIRYHIGENVLKVFSNLSPTFLQVPMDNELNHLREFGKFRLDVRKRVLWHQGEPVNLGLKEIELLSVLTENSGEVVTKTELLDKIWPESFVEESNLSRHVYVLRKMFKDHGESGGLIKTIPRRGYRFAGEVRKTPKAEIIVEKHALTRTLVEVEVAPPVMQPRLARTLFFNLSIVATATILLAAAGAFVGYRTFQPTVSAPEIKSLAVLPFKTIGDADVHQGLGLTDVLVTRLSNIQEFNVRPTSSVFSFENIDSLAAGRQLGVEAVLEGTIYRTNGRVRVMTRLLKVSDGSALWTGEFEKPEQEEFRLQHEIAIRVVDALALNLSRSEQSALIKRYTENPDAYQLYVKGRYEWNKRTWEGNIEAERLFRNAIELDPLFALAYVGLADSMLMNTVNSGQVQIAVQKALEIDPSLAEPHATLGFLKTFHKWEWQEAESSLRKSIELNPNYATAHHWLAQVLAIQGRNEEAKAAMLRALEINPLSYNFLADLGQIYYFDRDYKKAEEYCRRSLEIYPDFAFAREYLFDIHLKTGEYDQAVEEILGSDKIISSFKNEPAKYQKHLEAKLDEERKIYLEGGIKKFLENRVAKEQDEKFCYRNATIYSFIGEKEKALDCLEISSVNSGFLAVFVKADPVFDPLRYEPRYQEILRRMNF